MTQEMNLKKEIENATSKFGGAASSGTNVETSTGENRLQWFTRDSDDETTVIDLELDANVKVSFDQSVLSSSSEIATEEAAEFRPEKVLILTKLTRLEYERRTNPGLSEKELEQALKQRGSNYKRLVEHHDVHKNYLNVICEELGKRNIEHKIVQRWEYDKDAIDWADAVMTAGGDGTFLLGTSKIRDRYKPIIGINSDPTRIFMLGKKLPDFHFPLAFDRLLSGDFRWLCRQRLRITLYGKDALDCPIELHDQQLMNREYRWDEHVQEDNRSRTPDASPSDEPHRVLPYLALNDVFIGEALSARVSYYELQIDDQEKVKQKSSGIVVCTGSGSSSWYFNINKITNDCVSDLFSIVNEEFGLTVLPKDSEVIDRIRKTFNDQLIFCPSDLRMGYVVRDPIFNQTYHSMPPRGYATKRVEVKSRCFDGNLVIDGGLSYQFNAGAKAILEIRPEDALKTVIFR